MGDQEFPNFTVELPDDVADGMLLPGSCKDSGGRCVYAKPACVWMFVEDGKTSVTVAPALKTCETLGWQPMSGGG